MNEHAIERIDMVVVNLYPFAETIAQADVTMTDAIENIDIGGPTMVRAAAKNHADVGIVTDPNDYERVLSALNKGTTLTSALRYDLAVKAFEHTAQYDGMIAKSLGSRVNDSQQPEVFSRTLNLQFDKCRICATKTRTKKAAFYVENSALDKKEASIATAKQLQGKALSYNNIADTDAALECVKAFTAPACVIVKHANPCGVAVDPDQVAAYRTAFSTDPESSLWRYHRF